MTTPNNQTTPPEGMRLLTPEEYKNRLPEDSAYSPDGENWYKSGNIGKRPFIQHIYAIPITPTVPATGDTEAHHEYCDTLDPIIKGKPCNCKGRLMGDTTNEKGGEPCSPSHAEAGTQSANATVKGVHPPVAQSTGSSNAPAQVQSLSAGQLRAYELPFSVKGDNPPAIVDATGEAVLSMMWPVHEQTPQGEQLAVSYTKNWAQTICDLVNEANAKPVEQRQELLPCPFCGSAPRSYDVNGETPDGEGYGYWAVECPKCNGGEIGRFCGVHGEDKEDAETKWNTRK